MGERIYQQIWNAEGRTGAVAPGEVFLTWNDNTLRWETIDINNALLDREYEITVFDTATGQELESTKAEKFTTLSVNVRRLNVDVILETDEVDGSELVRLPDNIHIRTRISPIGGILASQAAKGEIVTG